MDTLTEQLAAVSFIDNISAPDASLTLINESEDESLIMMQKNPAEVAIRTVGHTILSFLPIRDVFTSYLTITTNTFQQVKEHYLYRYHASTNGRNKVSHNKLNSRDAFVLTAILDHMLWQADSSDITRLRGGQGNTKGSIKPSKRDEEGYGGPINFRYDHNHRPIPLHRVYHHNDDYSHVIAMMLQLFHTHPLQYLYGVYDRFYYVLFNHCNDFHPILLAKMKDVLVKEVQYWVTSRVFGTFIVLFEREDGTILISLEDNKVYLATTILGVSFSQLVAVKTVQIKKKSATDLAGGSPVTTTNDNKAVFGKYNPLKGKKIACMLYPFQDMIVTDGSIWKTSTATESEINAALRIYIQAEDERSINTTLPKVEYIETRTLDPNEIQQVKETHGTTLEMLKRLPSGNDEEGIWVFDEEIRIGFVEYQDESGQMSIITPHRGLAMTLMNRSDTVTQEEDVYFDRNDLSVDILFNLIVRQARRRNILSSTILYKPCKASYLVATLLKEICNVTDIWYHDPIPEWELVHPSHE